ncbi:MAG: hypothetical protein EOP92_38255 [Lysobacteraceae bacterium]|nr:MAG: hypothetical protein EOP92_38255 [Xanthomonadaceae bacterium]
MGEAGVPGVEVYSWQAFAAPRGLPNAVKARLHGAIVAALREPDVSAVLLGQGFDIVANSPAQFVAFQALEQERWRQVIVSGRITAD